MDAQIGVRAGLLLSLAAGQVWAAQQPTLRVNRFISPDTIYHISSPNSPKATTVTLELTGTGDSLVIGGKADVLMAIDLSGSMLSSYRGKLRLYYVHVSAFRFLDSLNSSTNRAALFGWSSRNVGIQLADTSNSSIYFQKWFGFSNDFQAAKQFIADSMGPYDIFDTLNPSIVPQTPLNTSIIVALNHLIAHAQNTGYLIILTDGVNNDAVEDSIVLNFVDQAYSKYQIKTYAIGFQGGNPNNPVNFTFLQQVALKGGGQAYLATEPNQLDSVFDYLSSQVIKTAATQIDPVKTPLVTDVLGPDIHFVQGSQQLNAGNKAASGLSVDSVGTYQKVSLNVSQVNLGDTVRVTYRIGAYLQAPSLLSVAMRTTNLPANVGNDTTNFSRAYFLKFDTIPQVIPFKSPDFVFVLSDPVGLRLSTAPSRDSPAPDTIYLNFSNLDSAVFGPAPFYATMEMAASGGSRGFFPLQSGWTFNPPSSWGGTGALLLAADSIASFTVRLDSGDAEAAVPLTIAATYRGSVYKDTVVFKSTYRYVSPTSKREGQLIRVAFDSTTAYPAGSPAPFTIIVINGDGDTVVESQYLPSFVEVTATHLSVVNGDTIPVSIADTLPVFFDGRGVFTGAFTAFTSGTNFLFFRAELPVSMAQAKDTLYRLTVPGAPDSIRVLPAGAPAGSLIRSDTLVAGGPPGSSGEGDYQAFLFDAFGNAITNPAVLNQLTWTVTGNLDPAPIVFTGVNRDAVTYSVQGFTTPGQGALSAHHGSLSDSLHLVVYVPLRVNRVVAREWFPDTSSPVYSDTLNPLSPFHVLRKVLGFPPSRIFSPGFGKDSALTLLSSKGYRPFLDGYLDYLDLVMEPGHGLRLDDSCVVEIAFEDPPESVFVYWKTASESRYYTLESVDTAAGRPSERYRVWLIPTFAGHPLENPILETGMRPFITFDNPAVGRRNAPDIFMGDSAYDSLYETPPAALRDSAAPVIAAYTFLNRICEPGAESAVKIFFSEAVRLPQPAPSLDNLRTAFVRITGKDTIRSLTDGTLTGITTAPALNDFYAKFVAANIAEAAYQLEISTGSENVFKPGVSTVTINPAPLLAQDAVVDITGNTSKGLASRAALLVPEASFAPAACNRSMITVANRYDASRYAWGVEHGEPVPLFFWWGQTLVNPLWSSESTGCGPAAEAELRKISIEIAVEIYDLFGNPVATPATHPGLRTVLNAHQLFWDPVSGSCIEKAEVDVRNLRSCRASGTYANCLPIWNCLNGKGRLVAPGGYIVRKTIRGSGTPEEEILKIVVTSRDRSASGP